MKSALKIVGAVAALVLVAGACTQSSSGGGGGWSRDPAVVDPATTPDPIAQNRIYLPVGAARGALAVVLHGTSSVPEAHYELAGALRADGYHVVLLRYSAGLGTLGACPDSEAAGYPECHREFRHETTFGAGVPDPDGVIRDHAAVNISLADSVVNRLLKLVDHMAVSIPSSGYAQFQQKTGGSCDVMNTTYGACELDWSKVAVLGHSQGAGVALYLSKFYRLRAVGLLSGAYDAWLSGGTATAAPWTTEADFDTPSTSVRTLMHSSDYGVPRIRAVSDALGVPGPEVSATTSPFTSNRLVTSLTPTCPWDSVPGHNSTAVDVCTPDGAYVDAWRFMAGS